jgi:hypothetical protein
MHKGNRQRNGNPPRGCRHIKNVDGCNKKGKTYEVVLPDININGLIKNVPEREVNAFKNEAKIRVIFLSDDCSARHAEIH